MKNLLKIIFVFAGGNLLGQNLVLNPGFEDHGEPVGNSPSKDNLQGNHVVKWYSPTSGSPDYYNTTSEYLFADCGLPKAHAGDAMAGMAVYDGLRNYREYIIGELSEPLIAGEEYKFSIAFALAEYSGFSVSQLGIYLSPEMVFEKGTMLPLKLIPQIIIDSTGQKGILGNWVVFEETYTAIGGEKFITIGNFLTDKKTSGTKISSEQKKNFPYAYYYIDDVSIIKAVDSTEIDSSKTFILDDSGTRYDDTLEIAPGKTLVANNIYFENDKSVLKEESFPILDEIVSEMNRQSNLKVEIDGHTDSNGSEKHNQQLSEDRAKAVMAYFVSKGISADRITTKGFGAKKPVTDELSEEGRSKNRRVEFIFSE